MGHKRNGKIVTPKDEWGTPPPLFKQLDDEFHFDIDAAATEQNALARKYFTKERNGLVHGWGAGNVFLNPPYSQGNIENFVIKAHIEGCLREPGTYIICLIPVASDTKWWHHSVMLAKEIRFIKGRVKFIGYDDAGNAVKNSPTFSSCICIFSHISERPSQVPIIGRTIHQVKV